MGNQIRNRESLIAFGKEDAWFAFMRIAHFIPLLLVHLIFLAPKNTATISHRNSLSFCILKNRTHYFLLNSLYHFGKFCKGFISVGGLDTKDLFKTRHAPPASAPLLHQLAYSQSSYGEVAFRIGSRCKKGGARLALSERLLPTLIPYNIVLMV